MSGLSDREVPFSGGYELITTQRGDFAVRLRGPVDGPVVMCAHGFPDDASTFDELAETLAQAGYRVAAANLRGYAPSPVEGDLSYRALVDDLLALAAVLSPTAPLAAYVGHDYGAQLGYGALARDPAKFHAAVMLSGAHPAVLVRNARRSLRQAWMSRYIIFFQAGPLADRAFAARDFASVDRLWRRWSPDWTPPQHHIAHVKAILAASMPAPAAMYRAGSFGDQLPPIDVPTLFITGKDDGCALPTLADGQEQLFTNDYHAETWADTGHFPHLEHPARTRRAILAWLERQ